MEIGTGYYYLTQEDVDILKEVLPDYYTGQFQSDFNIVKVFNNVTYYFAPESALDNDEKANLFNADLLNEWTYGRSGQAGVPIP